MVFSVIAILAILTIACMICNTTLRVAHELRLSGVQHPFRRRGLISTTLPAELIPTALDQALTDQTFALRAIGQSVQTWKREGTAFRVSGYGGQALQVQVRPGPSASESCLKASFWPGWFPLVMLVKLTFGSPVWSLVLIALLGAAIVGVDVRCTLGFVERCIRQLEGDAAPRPLGIPPAEPCSVGLKQAP